MSRFRASLGATLTAVAVAAIPSVLLSAPADAAAPVVVRVGPADLGPNGPWLRLQDDPGNAGRPPGVQEVSPFADPVRFDGSLHLAVAAAAEAQQAQAAHYFTSTVPLSTVAASPLSYDLYVKGSTSTPAAIPYGANLQLPAQCQGLFTTLSFQPQLATDSQGRTGAVADAWRHFDAGGSALWRTSRAVGPFAAQSDHPLSDYVSTCDAAGDGAIGVIANVGRLGDATASLDTYVDNLTVNGTVYDFAVPGTATGGITVGASGDCGGHGGGYGSGYGGYGSGSGGGHGKPCPPADGTITFTSPADGPAFSSVGTLLTFSGQGLTPGSLTVTANGLPVTLTAGPDGTLTAVVTPDPETDLGPDGTYSTTFTVAFNDARHGTVTLTAQLLAQGYDPLQPIGVTASARLG
ncbi:MULTISPECIES: hypothetical protein [unclassified Streptomyces]|uniref:hypothetical protein n=1 Tax=unclassified Streptomyces TaxID=2593676 RepID=UPI002E2B75F1|nr:hypothetical protein [Streptomyces sp. NBC_00223]